MTTKTLPAPVPLGRLTARRDPAAVTRASGRVTMVPGRRPAKPITFDSAL